MNHRENSLPTTRQAQLLGMSRVALYYLPRMGIEAMASLPGTSQRAPGHKIYTYLLRKLAVTRSNQFLALDTSYIPMVRGFIYLTAGVDVASRRAGAQGG